MALREVYLLYIQEKAKRPKELKQSEQRERQELRSQWGELEGSAEHAGIRRSMRSVAFSLKELGNHRTFLNGGVTLMTIL